MTRQILAIVALAVIVGLAARFVQKKPVPLWGFPKPIELIQPKEALAGADTASPDSAFAPADKPYAVDLSVAMGLFMKRKKARVHFLDAREQELYREGHIPGAVNIPFVELAKFADTLAALPKGDLYVLYCEGGDCHVSHELAEYMLARGWKRVAIFEGGWAEWSKETDFIEKAE